jgi:hypothetical protein
MRAVVGMNETPRLFDRHGRHVVPMTLCGLRIALEATGGEVRAECTKLGSFEGQLKALIALVERRFTTTPLGE